MPPPLDGNGESARRGRRIKAARTYAGITRDELAAAVELSGEQIGRYERGEQTPGRAMLQAIGRATGAPEWFLIGGFPSADPSTRFADEVRREAERQRARRAQELQDQRDADERDEDR